MIGNITKGEGFKDLLKYGLQEKKGYPIDSNISTTDERDYKQYLNTINAHNSRRSDVNKPVFHLSISLDKNDKVDDELFVKIGQEYLSRLGFNIGDEKEGINPYLMVRHTDTEHPHIHIIASRIKSDKTLVNDSNDFRKAQEISRDLELKYGFRVVPSESLKEEKQAEKNEKEKTKRLRSKDLKYTSPRKYLVNNINTAMKPLGSKKTTFKSFVVALNNKGIEININASNDLSKVNGVSYSFNRDGKEIIYKGSALGKKYGWNSLIQNVEFDFKKDKELLKKIVQNSRFNKVSSLSEKDKERIVSNFNARLTEYSNLKNVNIFNKEYRFSKLSFNDKQLTYLSNLNDEWNQKNYKNDPLKYFENAFRKQRYSEHSEGVKVYFGLSSEQQKTHQKVSNDLKLSLANQLKAYMEKEGFSFSHDLQMKTQSLRLSGKDHEELVQHIGEWGKRKFKLNPMDYFYEKYSVHKEYFDNSLVNNLGKLDGKYGLKTSSSIDAIKKIAEETNHDYRVPAAILKYEQAVKNGQTPNIVEFVRDSVQKDAAKAPISRQHQEAIYTTSNNMLEDFFKDFAKGMKSDVGGDQYREEQKRKPKRRRRRIQ